MNEKPKLIAIEGVDASGKATQSKKLAERLHGVVMPFPNYTSHTGNLIKKLLTGERRLDANSYQNEGITNERALVLQALQTINRYESVDEIRQHIMRETPIVFDRYFASGLVYGTMDGLSYYWLLRIQESLPVPDAWVLLDVPVEESVRRRPERRDQYETNLPFLQTVVEGYRSLFKHPPKNTGRWLVVDGRGNPEEVHERIVAALEIVC